MIGRRRVLGLVFVACRDDASSPLITVSSHFATLLCSSSVGVVLVGIYGRVVCGRISTGPLWTLEQC